MRVIVFTLFGLVVSGCTTISDLKQPTVQQHFVLEQDYTHSRIRGLFKYRYIAGLRAGTYSLVGEDSDGKYFASMGDCVIYYSPELPVPPSTSDKMGGIYIPNSRSDDPRLFTETRNTTDGSYAGVTGMMIVSATEDSIIYAPFEDQWEFVSSLNIKSGQAENAVCNKTNKQINKD
ncbi:hypothetical protein ACMZOO_00975 [Catenovulum sp. SX2]|uniref:hypothetical protein n=1 Tax=Catenovulum sp. SX2 TaxID=3398614 RepID=UPI003F8316B3